MSLFLYSNNTFEGKNFPDFIDVKDSARGKLLNTSGTWQPMNDDKHWYLDLNFSAGELYDKETSKSYYLFVKDSALIMMNFIGDPIKVIAYYFIKFRNDLLNADVKR